MQKKLSQKATKEPEHRFENLYGLLCNDQRRQTAWKTFRYSAPNTTEQKLRLI
jgi:hypothetical protein